MDNPDCHQKQLQKIEGICIPIASTYAARYRPEVPSTLRTPFLHDIALQHAYLQIPQGVVDLCAVASA